MSALTESPSATAAAASSTQDADAAVITTTPVSPAADEPATRPESPPPLPDKDADNTPNLEQQAPPAEEPPDNAAKDLESDLPVSAADGLIQKPFPRPLESARPPPPPELTAEQQKKYDTTLKAVSQWTTIPTTSATNAATEPITDDDRMFLTRECLLRYLRATKWNVQDALIRLKGTLIWRREYGLHKLTPDYISVENETGKQMILGYDIHARPCLYLIPKNQNTERSDRQIQHLVFMLERVIDLMGPDQETLALIINFNDSRSGQNASIAQAKQTLNILQYHYPERLGRALVINIPVVIWGFLKLITPFIDPQTRQKLVFNEDLRNHVPAAHLIKPVGGDVEFRYDHSIYWPALNKLAEQRRKAYRERWIQGGRRIGEYENYLKGGSSPSLSQREKGPDALAEKLEDLNVDMPKQNDSTTITTAAATS